MHKDQAPFSFHALEDRLRVAMPGAPLVRNSRLAVGALVAGGIGALVAVVGHKAFPADAQPYVAFAGLVLELAGLGLYVTQELVAEIRWFRNLRANFAVALEGDFSRYLDLILWLQTQPKRALEMRLTYLKNRQARTSARIAVLIGSIDKLGALPILAAVYLQLRGQNFLTGTSLWEGVVAMALIGVYVIAHLMLSLKRQLDLYVSLLDHALHSQAIEAGPDP